MSWKIMMCLQADYILDCDRGVCIKNIDEQSIFNKKPGQHTSPDRVFNWINFKIKGGNMFFSPIIIAAVILFRLLAADSKTATHRVVKRVRKLRFQKTGALLGNNFIDSRQLFVKLNKQLPNVMLINSIDANRAVRFIEDALGNNIKAIYRHSQFDFDESRALFNMIIVVTNDNRIIEIGGSYVELQYTLNKTSWADCFAEKIAQFQLPAPAKILTQNIRITGFAGQLN